MRGFGGKRRKKERENEQTQIGKETEACQPAAEVAIEEGQIRSYEMKRVLVLLIGVATVMACHAATGVAPPDAFAVPTSDNVGQNPNFWAGYSAGSIVPIVLPDAMYPDWWGYIAAVRVNEMPRTRMFIPINYNVGFDSAEETAAGYLWTHWETSCGVVVCGASPAAKRRKSLAPKQVTHLDLIEKGVKGVVKLTYRGARVVL